MSGTKQFKLLVDVPEGENLQEIMSVLSDRRCAKAFTLAALHSFIDTYKGQRLFEMLTAKSFPFEKKRNAGRNRKPVKGEPRVAVQTQAEPKSASRQTTPAEGVKGVHLTGAQVKNGLLGSKPAKA